MDKTKWSYLAGIFDGEGSVTINSYSRNTCDGRGNGPYRYIQHELLLSIKNTNRELMKWLVSTFGGVYYTTEFPNHWRTVYTWRPKGARNKEAFLLGILPYLIIKRTQTKLALDYLRLNGENAVEQRKELARKCHELNKIGESVTTNTPNLKIESDLTGDRESASQVTVTA